MRIRKTVALVLGAAAFLLAWLRPMCAVSVDGTRLLGEWRLSDVEAARAEALAAAEEIARGETRLPELEYDTRWRFAASGRERSELTRAILGEAEGVARVWEVSVDGEAIGLAADRSALGEVLMAAIAEAAPPDSLRAGFSSEIALRELYVPEGAATDLMELSAMIRSLVRVTWVSSSL